VGSREWARSPLARAILGLGITEIVCWGTTLYALGVLGQPIVDDTGWSRGVVFGGLSLGLIVAGVVSTAVGRAIDRHGARRVMSLGCVLSAAGLGLAAAAPHWSVYLLAWAVLGLAMRMTLYDAAFAALVQVAPSRGRRAISYLTLFGGFASSVFWPIGHVLEAAYGWRAALLAFAATNISLALPLTLWALPSASPEPAPARREADAAAAPAAPNSALDGSARTLAIVLFAIVASTGAFIFGAMSVHLPALLQANGLDAAAAVALAALKGVAQVAGRLAEIVFGSGFTAIAVGRFSTWLMPLAFVVLMLAGASFTGALAFVLVFGVANGLITIVRGSVPLALFGPNGFGALMGVLATPYLVVNAVAPFAFALIVDGWGYGAAAAALVATGLLSAAGMEILAAWHRRTMAHV
jgi:predicted MFS family arabinose efflux permease